MNTPSLDSASAGTARAHPIPPTSILAPFLTRSGKGRVLRAFGDEITLLMSGRETGGAYTAFIAVTPPGGGPPPHRHDREDEWFFILEGPVSFFTEGRWHDAQAGDFVFAPRGSVHTFKNNGSRASRMLIHTTPSGFEDFFAEAEVEFSRPGGPDFARAIGIAAKHGIHIVTP